jgi:HEAT repeat protein
MVSVLPMASQDDLASTVAQLFAAERAARKAQDELTEAEPERLLPLLERSTAQALALDEVDEDEASLRLVRIATLLGEMQGPRAVDLLIDILGSDEPEARRAAGEALSGLAFDRFKEVALGVERALERLPLGNPALAELPYLLSDVPEPGVLKLLARFLVAGDVDAVAAAIEAVVELGDPAAVPLLERLLGDARRVQLEDDGGTEGDASLGELASEAIAMLSEGSEA